jgi:hypothetical protein
LAGSRYAARVCTTCAFEASKAVAASGGPATVPALLAAAAAKVVADSLGQVALNSSAAWIKPRLMWMFTVLIVTGSLTAATLIFS